MPRADVATGSSRGSHGRHGRAAILAALLLAAAGCGDGSPPAATAPERACSDCHSALDHAGRFSVLAHRTTASGEPFRCRDCHGEQFGAVTSATCLACHRDAAPGFVGGHVADWGTDCLACHDGRRFSRDRFDHGATRFSLEGRHRPLGCTACHADARSFSDFGAAADGCFGCHAADDPHAGALGEQCGACHDPEGWRGVDFDHPFAPGGHRRSPDGDPFVCEDCHGPGLAPVPSSRCRACHATNDPAFTGGHVEAWGPECLACHDGARFTGPFDHGTTGWPLEGRHRGVACGSCHVGVVAVAGFADAPRSCYGCHADDDVHASLFGTGCGSCHDPSGWEAVAHGFAVVHDHPADPGCEVCHPDAPAGYATYSCYGCHRHRLERTLEEHLDADVSDFSDDCMRCHPL